MKKALFWDFDGTLACENRINSYSRWSYSLYTVLSNLKYNINIEEIRQHLGNVYSWDHPEISYTESTGIKWWENFFCKIIPFYELHGVSEKDAEAANTYLRNHFLDYKNYSMYDDAEQTLQKCMDMDYKNYILSNNFPELPDIVKDLGFGKYFADCIVSAKHGYEKPRIEIFEIALNIAGNPDISYMIGDNPVADIQGGKAAGMKTVLVHKESPVSADYKCAELSEIPLILL